MSSSSNGYSTKAVSEKGAGRQGDCVPGIGDKLRKQLGIGPESRRGEGPEPLAALPQGIKGQHINLVKSSQCTVYKWDITECRLGRLDSFLSLL